MDVFIANRGKKHGKLVKRKYPRSKKMTLGQLLGKRRNPKKAKGAKRRKNRWFKASSKPKRKSKLSILKGAMKMARKTRRGKRRKNVWYNDRPGHRKAAKKGWSRRNRKSSKKARAMRAYWRKVKAGKAHRKVSRKRSKARKGGRKSTKRARAARKGRATRKRHVTRGRKARRHYRTTFTRKATLTPSQAAWFAEGRSKHFLTNPRKRRKSRRARRSNPGRKISRRVYRRNPAALPVVGSLPVVGEYFNFGTIKMVGGVGAGFIASGMLGDKLATMLMEKVTFLAAYPIIVRPLSMLIVGGGATLVIGKMLKMPTIAKYIFLGAGVAAAVDVLSNVYVKITGGLQDYVQYGDQGQVERGVLGDFVQLQGLGGMPGLGSQAAVEAGLLNDYVQL